MLRLGLSASSALPARNGESDRALASVAAGVLRAPPCSRAGGGVSCSTAAQSFRPASVKSSGALAAARTAAVASRWRGLTVPSTACAAAASPSAGPPAADGSSNASSTPPATVDPSSYQSLSLLILLHECVQRAYGRPLMEKSTDLLALAPALDALPCCVALLAPPPPALPGIAAASSSASRPAATADASTRDRITSGAGASGSGSTSSSGAAGLRVRFLNRAAAEALKAPGWMAAAGASGGGGSKGSGAAGADVSVPRAVAWPLLAEGDAEGATALLEAMAAHGPPRRGRLCSLTLSRGPEVWGPGGSSSSGGGGGDGCGAGTAPALALRCPQALVLSLVSPNEVCAGVAVLFDRWEMVEAAPGSDTSGAATASRWGSVRLEGRPLVPEVPPGSQPADASVIESLQDAVRAQADAVRALKTKEGLGNQDPRVVAAVAELGRLKAELELASRLRQAFGEPAGVVAALVAAPEAAAAGAAGAAPPKA
ncbi:hypothetical protein HYH03_003738 [Edaphochlamys debaryana]|uniref:Uncharacterized protein n=1 Tax=Edaphochlamys debaryana TaxID=47281 RepID=A0A835YGX8_9CHLO|nr:hypothetical protein HYH03_003738 [Edaphochlamys debaryana]|eukprot:KAG2498485.1 hypothetical protein HYH03_003738 [Edaphochlamys debaryana]